jgi:hypothetical protein
MLTVAYMLTLHFRERGVGDVWDSIIYPGMKNAVVSALICCQDVVEQKKVCNYQFSFISCNFTTSSVVTVLVVRSANDF